jgi:tetratricopeptide (TPR) repeat protein
MVAQAHLLARQGRLPDAEQLLRLAIAAAPRDHAALHLLGYLRHEQGDLAGAIDLLRRAIRVESSLGAYHGNLANALLAAEQFEAAAASYRRVLALDRTSIPARFGLGMSRLGLGQHAAAAADLAAVVATQPDHADALANLAVVNAKLGRADQARSHAARAAALRPASYAIHLNCGLALRQAGDLAAALNHLRRATSLNPTHPDAAYQCGAVLHGLDQLEQAAEQLQTALSLAPGMVPALYELGQVLNRLRDLAGAEQCFEQALARDPRASQLLLGLARTRHLQGQGAAARALIDQARNAGADPANCLTMAGLTYQSEGDFTAAAQSFRSAIAVSPAHGQAQLCLTLIETPSDPAGHIAELSMLCELPALDADERASLHHALGHAHDKVGDVDAAFRHFDAGNQIRRALYPYDVAAAPALMDRLVATFTPDLVAAKAGLGSQSTRPIFVVGMMRSGTTLVEQILASHPAVHGHGELDHMRRIAADLPRQLGGAMSYPECAAALDAQTTAACAETYLARLDQDGASRPFSVDKMPHNFERLGLIALLFPQARIIHCTRDPLDTCLSNYLHDFAGDNRFTTDLRDLGEYFQLYRRLMAHWQAVLPIRIIDVPYESLVAEPAAWSRRIVAELGLPWDDRCLAFHKTARSVHTYSLWQVRQPIYQTAVQRWRAYAHHLGPLLEALEIPAPAG